MTCARAVGGGPGGAAPRSDDRAAAADRTSFRGGIPAGHYNSGVSGDRLEEGGEYRVKLEYPLDYTFKVIGLARDDFAEHARRLVERLAIAAPPELVSVRQSAQGKYHSVSVVARLESEEQRRAVYQALYDDERVVYYL
jgi:uncharacterized protein